MFKTGEKVIFKNISNREYAWKLNDGEAYIIVNKGLDNQGILFYGVENKNGVCTTWYLDEDFISIKKLRKQKLEKIKKITEEYLCENCIYFSVGAMCPTCDNHSKFEKK